MSNRNNLLRPVGMLEKLYTARQVLGIYNSVIVTATYTIPSIHTKNDIYSMISGTIPALLWRHPALCSYVEGQATSSPIFRRVDTVRVSDVLQVLDLEIEKDELLVRKLEELHDQPWLLDAKPLWKLVVLREPPPPNSASRTSEQQLHIAFIYHHVIGDGLSGLAFHKSLLNELSRSMLSSPAADPSPIPSVITVPNAIKLIEPIESLIPFPVSWSFLAKQILNEYAPRWLVGAQAPIWAGLPVQSPDKLPSRSRLRVVSIPAHEVAVLLEECRKQGVTLTCLLTASVVGALGSTWLDPGPEAVMELRLGIERQLDLGKEIEIEIDVPRLALKGITPYSLRRASGTSNDEIANQISAFSTDYPAALLARIRAALSSPSSSPSSSSSTPDKAIFVQVMWEIARTLHAQMQTELATCPRDNVVGLLPYISDYLAFYTKKFGGKREASFEVSNLGAFEGLGEGQGQRNANPGWKLQDLIFTQGAAPTGPAININVVGIRGGPLTVAVGWQEGVVREAVVQALVRGLENLPGLLRGE